MSVSPVDEGKANERRAARNVTIGALLQFDGQSRARHAMTRVTVLTAVVTVRVSADDDVTQLSR